MITMAWKVIHKYAVACSAIWRDIKAVRRGNKNTPNEEWWISVMEKSVFPGTLVTRGFTNIFQLNPVWNQSGTHPKNWVACQWICVKMRYCVVSKFLVKLDLPLCHENMELNLLLWANYPMPSMSMCSSQTACFLFEQMFLVTVYKNSNYGICYLFFPE